MMIMVKKIVIVVTMITMMAIAIVTTVMKT